MPDFLGNSDEPLQLHEYDVTYWLGDGHEHHQVVAALDEDSARDIAADILQLDGINGRVVTVKYLGPGDTL